MRFSGPWRRALSGRSNGSPPGWWSTTSWPLADNAPLVVLTHYPQASDVFSWLDGAGIVAWLVKSALLVAGRAPCHGAGAARLARADWKVLALGLVPTAAANPFSAVHALTDAVAQSEGIEFGYRRVALLLLAWLAGIGARRGQLRRMDAEYVAAAAVAGRCGSIACVAVGAHARSAARVLN